MLGFLFCFVLFVLFCLRILKMNLYLFYMIIVFLDTKLVQIAAQGSAWTICLIYLVNAMAADGPANQNQGDKALVAMILT